MGEAWNLFLNWINSIGQQNTSSNLQLPVAQPAEERYRGGTRIYPNYDRVQHDINMKSFDNVYGVAEDAPYPRYIPAEIFRMVSGNDTIYREAPRTDKYKRPFRNRIKRKASNKDANLNEYNTLRRRFDSAWNAANDAQ